MVAGVAHRQVEHDGTEPGYHPDDQPKQQPLLHELEVSDETPQAAAACEWIWFEFFASFYIGVVGLRHHRTLAAQGGRHDWRSAANGIFGPRSGYTD
jgi:hypothetical protein